MFDVVIPTYNNLEELKGCLKGFESQSYKDFRVLICVDGSTDGTLEYLSNAEFSFNSLVLKHKNNEHKGRNETRNLAMPELSGEFILMFDSDIVPDDNLLQKHYDLLREIDCISVGEINYTNATENIWALYLMSRGKGKFDDLDEMPAYYLNTQNAALKSKYYLESGGQDVELSKSYGGDDTELGYRIGKQYNINAVFNKKATGNSHLNKDLNRALEQMEEFGARNLRLIRKLHPEFTGIFNFYILESRKPHLIIFRQFIIDFFAAWAKILIKITSSPFNLKFVHFLVFYSIVKGYEMGSEK